MFIYAFIHLHINILKPSQCLNSILSQLFCINFSTRIKSSQFTSHSTCFFRYTCIYIYVYTQYQINILKPLQCPQLQRAQGYVQLAPARKLAWVFLFWLALAQVSRFWHVLRGWSGENTSRDWQASMQVFLWRVVRQVNDATLTRQIDNSRMKLARVC